MSPELRERLDALRNYKMSPQELFEQRVSFVYSGQADGPHAKSKDEIRQMLVDSHGYPDTMLTRETALQLLTKVRNEVFGALRRHSVNEQCFAEVAMITEANIRALQKLAPIAGE
jgi:hypothetical protein